MANDEVAAATAPVDDKPWTTLCTVIAVDTTSFSYRACATCERTLPDDPADCPCALCARRIPSPSSTRFFRLLLSIATFDKVMVVICFDRAARALFGCSADEFFQFCKIHESAAGKVAEVLEGEMCQMTLRRPKNGNAQHLRAVSVVPLCHGFCPVIERLRRLCGHDVRCSLSAGEVFAGMVLFSYGVFFLHICH